MPRSPNLWGAILVLLAGCLTVSSLASSISGSLNTEIGWDQIVAASRLEWAWEQGVHRPWWMQHLARDPSFPIQYSPSVLTYALGALGWIGLAPAVALNGLGAAAVLIGALGTYLLARRFLPPAPAAVAGATFALSPYALMSLYVHGDYSLLWLTALLPYWLWGWAELCARGTRRGCLALSIATAAMMAVGGAALAFVVPVATLYAGWRAFREGQPHRPALVLAVVGGLLASAVAWLPGWAELIGEAGRLGAGWRRAALQSVSLGELLALPRAVDRRALGDVLPLGLGGHLVLLALPALAHLRRQTTRPRGHVIFMLATAVGYSLLVLPQAAPLWAGLPHILTPNPYALLGPAALAVALLVGAGLEAWSTWRVDAGRVALALTLAALVVGAGPYLFPRPPHPEPGGVTLPAALTVPAPGPEASISAWPLRVPVSGAAADAGGSLLVGRMQLLATGSDWLRVLVRGEGDAAVLLPLRHSPDISAGVSERMQPLLADPETGLARVALADGGDQEIELRLTRSRTGRWGTWLSLTGAGLLLGGLSVGGRQRTLRVRGSAGGLTVVDLRLPTLALGIVVWAQLVYIAPRTTWFRESSPPGAVARAQHARADVLGGKVALLGYDLLRNLPPQGESLGLTLYWQPLEQLTADYRAFVQLVTPADGRVVWRTETATPGGLPASAWDPSLYVQDRQRPILPGDLPAARYQVRVGLYDQASGQALTTGEGESSVYLQDIQVLYHFPLDVKRFPGRDWYRFGEQATLLGFDLSRASLSAGETTTLALFWRAEETVARRLKRFVHLVNGDGNIVAQWEGWPVDGTYPTDLWLSQHNIADELTLSVPASAPPGEYHLVVGLRDPDTLERPEVVRRGSEPLPERAVTLPVTVRVTD